MEKELLVINTLVFRNQLKDGMLQSELLDVIHNLGIKKVEIRREFIRDFNLELIDLRDKANSIDMELFYSIPDSLYKDGVIQFESIETYFKEAYTIGCTNVKMNIGIYNMVTSEDVNRINKLCEQYLIKLTVENDQTEIGGKLTVIKTFIEKYKQLGGKISFTFDIGNWIWQNEDPMENAKQLKEYVTYIHIKDVLGNENPKTVLLNEGELAWKSILAILPQDVPLAIEYPCGTNAAKQLATEVDKLMGLNASN